MGHASITETFDRYGHLFPGTKTKPPGYWTTTSSAQLAAQARKSLQR
ncbi:MAG: hypothetical protein M3526_05970 [Actinomycetota bacterium]|jgi:hypothetical protein|nr:hypothetical protein [Actinomycetota bacterium]